MASLERRTVVLHQARVSASTDAGGDCCRASAKREAMSMSGIETSRERLRKWRGD
jgi:hypothetical protein